MSEYEILNNRYYLERQLGSGGMAVVYRAQDLTLERIVAVKILRERFSRDSEFRRLFRQEARAVAKLSHPNIVTVHDISLQEDRVYIVMEYVPGTDLKAILSKYGRLGASEGTALMIQACDGIGYAHHSGFVHCDIKPQNLLVRPDNRIKVVDFGIARALASISPDEKSDTVWGSPKYFSPEQARGVAPSPASDVYSLGVVFYEMLTGQVPFQAETSEELARLHREVEPPSPRTLNPIITPSLEEFLLVALSKKIENRYFDAVEMSAALKQINEFLPTQQLTESTIGSYPARIAEPAFKEKELTALPLTVTTKPVREKRTLHPVRSPRKIEVSEYRTLFDWVTWILALLMIIAVGGLIPFWLWVYYIVYPPVQ